MNNKTDLKTKMFEELMICFRKQYPENNEWRILGQIIFSVNIINNEL